jgi:hypothetical protein
MKQVQHTTLAATARRAAAALAVAALGAPLLVQAQAESSPQDTYRADRAECMAGRTTQSRTLCLYDARLAFEAAKEGRLQAVDPVELERNTLARCDGVPIEARDSCLRIAQGEGEREGSVEEGAVVMWLEDDASTATVSQNDSPQ